MNNKIKEILGCYQRTKRKFVVSRVGKRVLQLHEVERYHEPLTIHHLIMRVPGDKTVWQCITEVTSGESKTS